MIPSGRKIYISDIDSKNQIVGSSVSKSNFEIRYPNLYQERNFKLPNGSFYQLRYFTNGIKLKIDYSGGSYFVISEADNRTK